MTVLVLNSVLFIFIVLPEYPRLIASDLLLDMLVIVLKLLAIKRRYSLTLKVSDPN